MTIPDLRLRLASARLAWPGDRGTGWALRALAEDGRWRSVARRGPADPQLS